MSCLPLALTTLLLLPARQEPAPAVPPAVKPYKVGTRLTDEIVLPDLAGKEHKLFEENPERVIVLVFWSFQDPVSRAYVKELTGIQRARKERLALYLVDSNHDELVAGTGDPLDKVRRYFEQEKIELPLLVDRDNRVADDFAAISNNHAFALDANRTLRYQGGIDDDPRGERREKEGPVQDWLRTAVDTLLRGEKLPASETWTRPSGRPIKRAPKTTPKPGG